MATLALEQRAGVCVVCLAFPDFIRVGWGGVGVLKRHVGANKWQRGSATTTNKQKERERQRQRETNRQTDRQTERERECVGISSICRYIHTQRERIYIYREI